MLAFHLGNLTQTEIWNQGERFDRIQIEGAPDGGPEGWPELPSLVRFVLIPPQSGVELKVTNVQSHLLTNINPILTSRPGWRERQNSQPRV